MGKLVVANLLVLYLSLSYLLPSLACPHCPRPTPSPPPPKPKACPPPPPPKPKACPPPPPPPKPKPSPSPPTPKPKPSPPTPSPTSKCPINTIKLDLCVDILGSLIHIGIGPSAKEACCPVLNGIADLDAALCLCTALKAKVLNISILLPIALELLVEDCGKHVPSDYQCPA